MGIEVTTLCYIVRGDEVLMLHRTKKKSDLNEGKWIGVGGHVKAGESPYDCVRRETLEETGLTLQSLSFRAVITFVYGDVTEYMMLFSSDSFSGELKDCDEGVLEWKKKEEVFDLPIWEGDRKFLPLLFSGEPFFSMKLSYDNEGRLISAHKETS